MELNNYYLRNKGTSVSPKRTKRGVCSIPAQQIQLLSNNVLRVWEPGLGWTVRTPYPNTSPHATCSNRDTHSLTGNALQQQQQQQQEQQLVDAAGKEYSTFWCCFIHMPIFFSSVPFSLWLTAICILKKQGFLLHYPSPDPRFRIPPDGLELQEGMYLV